MSNEIKSKVIGQLKQDKYNPTWWIGKKVKIPFFEDEKLTITFIDYTPEEDKSFVEEADKALMNFLELTEKDKFTISELVYKNYTDFLEMVGEDADEFRLEINENNEIWDFVYPSEIYVSRRDRRDKDIYVQIACECDWEEEHGLQLMFRQGRKLTRVSDQDGHLTEADAYDKPDSEDELLSQFDK